MIQYHIRVRNKMESLVYDLFLYKMLLSRAQNLLSKYRKSSSSYREVLAIFLFKDGIVQGIVRILCHATLHLILPLDIDKIIYAIEDWRKGEVNGKTFFLNAHTVYSKEPNLKEFGVIDIE